MTSRPKRRKAKPMNVKATTNRRVVSHQQWVRGFECSVAGKVDACQGGIEFAHVRQDLPPEDKGGMGFKSKDKWGIPLCWWHHGTQHKTTEKKFGEDYGINMKAIAADLAKQSPALRKLEREMEQG